MNPIRKHLELVRANKMLTDFGFDATSPAQAASQALDLIREQNKILVQHGQLLDAIKSARADNCTVTYLIPYEYQCSKYHNGGPVITAHANTMIHVNGGIKTWEKVQEIANFIAANDLKDRINPKVVIQGLFETNRWIPHQTQPAEASHSEP